MALLAIECERSEDGSWNWHFISETGRKLWSGEGHYPTILDAVKAGRKVRTRFQSQQAEVDHCRR